MRSCICALAGTTACIACPNNQDVIFVDKKINDDTKPDNTLLIQYLLASEKFKDLSAERDKYKDLYSNTKAEMTKYAQEAGRLAAERDRYKAERDDLIDIITLALDAIDERDYPATVAELTAALAKIKL